MRTAGTNESIFRELSFFDASLYNDEVVLRDTNNNNDANGKGHEKQPSSPTVSVLSPRPMQQPAIPPPVANPISSNNAMDRRRPLSLSQVPEWSNNDYRMFWNDESNIVYPLPNIIDLIYTQTIDTNISLQYANDGLRDPKWVDLEQKPHTVFWDD